MLSCVDDDGFYYNNYATKKVELKKQKKKSKRNARKSFQMFCKLPNGKTIILDNNHDSTTVEILKEKIYNKEGYPPLQQLLSYEKKYLEDNCPISMYNIKSESTIYLKLPIRGVIMYYLLVRILIVHQAYTLPVEQ